MVQPRLHIESTLVTLGEAQVEIPLKVAGKYRDLSHLTREQKKQLRTVEKKELQRKKREANTLGQQGKEQQAFPKKKKARTLPDKVTPNQSLEEDVPIVQAKRIRIPKPSKQNPVQVAEAGPSVSEQGYAQQEMQGQQLQPSAATEDHIRHMEDQKRAFPDQSRTWRHLNRGLRCNHHSTMTLQPFRARFLPSHFLQALQQAHPSLLILGL